MAGKSLKDLQPFEKLRHPSKKARFRYGAFGLALVLSGLFHLISLRELDGGLVKKNPRPPAKPVKITINPVPKPKAPEAKQTKKDDELLKKLLETPQEKTERPKDSSFAGVVDHKAVKETRLKNIPNEQKAQDAGQGARNQEKKKLGEINGQKVDSKIPKNLQDKNKPKKPSPDPTASKEVVANGPQLKEMLTTSKVKVNPKKPRNSYEALLPQGDSIDREHLEAGYREYVDESIAVGDKIDINTSEYRYIGYFTNLRKAIELVWNYPKEASRRGLQGEVGLEFAIEKDGRASQVKVLKSSGYEMLDRAIVEAIHLASPFSPLPDGFGKKKIVVTGSFRYVLYGYNVN